MKKKVLFASILASLFIEANAQTAPAYTLDYAVDMGASWSEMLDTWEPGKPFSDKSGYIDENFFVSRVRPKARIKNDKTQVVPTRGDERKVLWWCPVGENSKVWGPLPRYNFNADNFSMWQYLDYHGNWSNGWIRVPGVFNDVAHKNGVMTGCLIFFEGSVSPELQKLVKKEGSEFKYAKKFVQILKFYGLDGVGVNPEGGLGQPLADNLKGFFAACHDAATEIDWHFKVIWYESQTNEGYVSWTDQLSDRNDEWFSKDGKTVTDAYFLNYNWNPNKLATSLATAQKLQRNTYDVYAGMDIQGRGLHNNAGADGNWVLLKDQPFSIGLWGAHDDNVIHQSSTENETSDLAIQNLYQEKLEMFFSGGKRNPAICPNINNERRGFGKADLEGFHGIAAFVNAQSTLNTLPFVTRFNLGNGTFFKNEGVTTFGNKWYNIGMQDFLPTWRWWITNSWAEATSVPADAINLDFTFDDAWYGGSALKIHGATANSKVRLFKTELDVTDGCEVSVTYKMVNGGTSPKLALCFSKTGSENNFVSYSLPDVTKVGEWFTAKVKLSEVGVNAGDKIACIALDVQNTTPSYELLLGEMSIIDPAQTMTPADITITHAEVLGGHFNSSDVKVIWRCGDKDINEAKGTPVYNDDVNAWYYEVYVRENENSEPALCTATTSWAAYIVGAPSALEDKTVQVGVCAVNPAGERSAIVWSEKMERVVDPIETITIDKEIIKPGQEFTVKFYDVTHAPATFKLKKATDATDAGTFNGVTKFTTSLNEVGFYDMEVTIGDVATMYRGFVQVTPEETGGVNELTGLNVDKKAAAVNEDVTFSYEGVKRDGTVSRGLHLTDVQSFTLPIELCNKTPFTVAFWMKIDENVQPSSEGTALYSQRNYADGWPKNAWGDVWVDIAPENYIWVRLLGNAGNKGTIAEDYKVIPNKWAHIAFSVNGNTTKMYFNGKLVDQYTGPHSYEGKGTPRFGGSAASRSGFVGSLDEIQFYNRAVTDDEVVAAMNGFDPDIDELPAGLVGYFNFETDPDEEGYFENFGSEGTYKGAVTTVKTIEKVDNDVPVTAPQMSTGVPFRTGVMEITSATTWNLNGATMKEQNDEAGTAKVTYATDGTYDAQVTLENVYGKVTTAVSDCVVIGTGGSGIEETGTVQLRMYPNPFKDVINLVFAESGNYVVYVYTSAGQLVKTLGVDAVMGDIKQLSVGEQGMYYVRVTKGGKDVKSFKVVKE